MPEHEPRKMSEEGIILALGDVSKGLHKIFTALECAQSGVGLIHESFHDLVACRFSLPESFEDDCIPAPTHHYEPRRYAEVDRSDWVDIHYEWQKHPPHCEPLKPSKGQH